MTNPMVTETERFGSRYQTEGNRYIGECECCGEDLTTDFESYSDRFGYNFCSEECFKSFYGFKERND